MSAAREAVLGFDTATEEVVVGTACRGAISHRATVGAPAGERPRHAQALMGEIERAVTAAGGWDAVERIGVGVGPGSFTGLRVGIATARALGQAFGRPLVPVGSLAALARGIAARQREAACLAVFDARRGEVFAELHGPSGEMIAGPVVIAPDEIATWLARQARRDALNGQRVVLAAGSGALRFRSELEAAGAEVLPGDDAAHRLAADHVCAIAAAGTGCPPERVRPVYLREPDAKRWLERDRS